MKSQLTNRKFYNKWLWKITLNIKGVNCFRTVDPRKQDIPKSWHGDILSLANLLKDIQDYQLRIERSHVDVYINTQNHFEKLYKTFEKNVVHYFEPHQSLLDSNEKIIIANKLPHDVYQYKVFLKPHNIKNVEDKLAFLGWLDSQNSKIYISDTVKNWFIHTSWNWDRRYIYVENPETLLLLNMRCPEAVGSTYKYKISDK